MKIFEPVFQNLMMQAIKSECGPALEDGSYPSPYLTERQAVQAVVQHQELVSGFFCCIFYNILMWMSSYVTCSNIG